MFLITFVYAWMVMLFLGNLGESLSYVASIPAGVALWLLTPGPNN